MGIKTFLLYLLRWQASTLVLYPVVYWLGPGFWAVVLANLIGGCIFFWIDKWLFSMKRGKK